MFYLDRHKLSFHALKVRFILITLSVAPLVGTYSYSNRQLTSPFICPIKALTGIPCPGCGMTRSFLALAQGNLVESINYHLFGFLLFIGLFLTTIHLSIEIVTQRKLRTFMVNGLLLKQLNFLVYSLCLSIMDCAFLLV